MKSKHFGLGGAAALVAGLFMPIASMPMVGAVNLFGGGTNDIAIALLVLASIAAALAVRGHMPDVLWPGIAAAGTVLFAFVRWQITLHDMRESLAKELAGNPFAGIAQNMAGTAQLQWGWLVLAAGAGLMIYGSYLTRRESEVATFSMPDNGAKTIAALSLVLLAANPGLFAYGKLKSAKSADGDHGAVASTDAADAAAAAAEAAKTTASNAEKAEYIKDNLVIYDVTAKYIDSLMDGRIPAIKFKIKNNGDKTINKVTVRVVFFDNKGNAIAEEEYHPIWVVESSFSDDNTPLRPNYIWSQESDSFFAAKKVPSEWETGKVSVTIPEIIFAPKSTKS